jgi:DNA polymerase-3 subunit epsilon
MDKQHHWQKDSKYYKLTLQPNLFGTTDVICHWGRYGTNRGGYKIIACKDQQEIDNAIQLITKRRQIRGYLLNNHD